MLGGHSEREMGKGGVCSLCYWRRYLAGTSEGILRGKWGKERYVVYVTGVVTSRVLPRLSGLRGFAGGQYFPAVFEVLKKLFPFISMADPFSA